MTCTCDNPQPAASPLLPTPSPRLPRLLFAGWRGADLARDAPAILEALALGASIISTRIDPDGDDDLIPHLTLIHGDYLGADRIADEIGRRLGWIVEAHPDLYVDFCVATPGPDSTGTWTVVRDMAAAGISVLVVPLTHSEPRSVMAGHRRHTDTDTDAGDGVGP